MGIGLARDRADDQTARLLAIRRCLARIAHDHISGYARLTLGGMEALNEAAAANEAALAAQRTLRQELEVEVERYRAKR